MSLQSRTVEHIKELLKKQGIPQSELAKKLNVSLPLIGKMFAGETPISLDRLEAIAKLLKTTPHSLLTGDFQEEETGVVYPEDSLPGVVHAMAAKQKQLLQLQKEVTDLNKQLQKLTGI